MEITKSITLTLCECCLWWTLLTVTAVIVVAYEIVVQA